MCPLSVQNTFLSNHRMQIYHRQTYNEIKVNGQNSSYPLPAHSALRLSLVGMTRKRLYSWWGRRPLHRRPLFNASKKDSCVPFEAVEWLWRPLQQFTFGTIYLIPASTPLPFLIFRSNQVHPFHLNSTRTCATLCTSSAVVVRSEQPSQVPFVSKRRSQKCSFWLHERREPERPLLEAGLNSQHGRIGLICCIMNFSSYCQFMKG